MNEDALIVFVKNPVLGKVKRRLSDTMGEAEALKIYNYLLDHTLGVCRDTEMLCYIYHQDPFVEFEDRWEAENFEHAAQIGMFMPMYLRMAHAFSEVSAKHKRAVIICADCPFVTSQLIYKAFAALDNSEMCIGPSRDGNYYLLGLNFEKIGKNKVAKILKWDIFENLEYTMETVYNATIARAHFQGFEVATLPEFYDIDTQQDWENYLAQKK